MVMAVTVLMPVVVAVAMTTAMIVSVFYEHVSIYKHYLRGHRVVHTVQEEHANKIQAKAHTSHNQD